MQGSGDASRDFLDDFLLTYFQVFKAGPKVSKINKQRNAFDVLRFRENAIKVLRTLSGP